MEELSALKKKEKKIQKIFLISSLFLQGALLDKRFH